jgi:thiamine-monophosphate kinase
MNGEQRHSSEFDRIARYFAPLAASFPGAFGLRDDAAVIAPADGAEFVVTTDTIVAGVHFLGDEPPALVAGKLLRVNLSDLAAMGASPRAYTLNVALPGSIDDPWLEAFAFGLAEDQERFGIALIGGDSVSTPGPAVFTLTAIGEVPVGRALRRAGARPGDMVFVSGTIGDGALGLRVLRGALDGLADVERGALIERYRRPEPRLKLGRRLLGLAHAAADISDGLVADLSHIAEASGVAATIEVEAVPLSPAARSALVADAALLETVLTGGDDYELVFCAPPEKAEALRTLAKEIDLPLTAVGAIAEGSGVRVLDADGAPVTFLQAGYTHGASQA